jgi:hypothetical protein
LIGLDAADPILVQQWIEDGTLPNLAALKKTGTYVRLTTSAKFLAGSPWPTFYTCQPPCNHGVYQDFQWCHERMGYYSPKPDWLPISPFWRHLDNDVFVIAQASRFPVGRAMTNLLRPIPIRGKSFQRSNTVLDDGRLGLNPMDSPQSITCLDSGSNSSRIHDNPQDWLCGC